MILPPTRGGWPRCERWSGTTAHWWSTLSVPSRASRTRCDGCGCSSPLTSPTSRIRSRRSLRRSSQTCADARRMLIGLGENLAGHRAFRELISSEAVDVVRCDATVVGGVSEFMASAALASAYGLEVSAHVHPNIHVQFGAAISNLHRAGLEYMAPDSGLDGLDDLLRPQAGGPQRRGSRPDRPGLGLDWDWDAVEGSPVSTDWRGAPGHDRRLEDAGSPDGPFSFPWDAPLVPPFPIEFRNVSILTVAWRTDPAAIASLLPPPLEPTGDVVLAHIYSMPDVDFVGAAHECNVMFGARLSNGEQVVQGGYSIGLYLDSDVGVAHGREVHGQPKKMAALKLETRGDLIVAEVERNGITILTATLPYKQRAVEARRHQPPFRLRGEHQLQADSAYRRHPGDQAADRAPPHRRRVARVLDRPVDCRTSPQRAGTRLAAPRARVHSDGFFWRADFTLVAGRVLHDYLTEDSP